MNTHQPLDCRIQHTRQLLQEALFQLIIEQGYEGISIADITERANLGRTTFYLHYRDKEDLPQESVKALMYHLALDVEPGAEETSTCSEHSIRIFQHVERQLPLYRALLREFGLANIGNLMRSYFADLCQRVILRDMLTSGILSSLRRMR
jgi:AcrR family transcriptional regulator